MKTKFTVLNLLILIAPLISFSQIIPKDIIDRVNRSAYIFEGEVVRSDGYWNAKENYIYTSLTIDIKKIFKGNLQCGKVELITSGGEFGDSVELEISHNLVLSKGQKGIFMCNQTNKELPVVDYFPENNYQKLETIYNEQGFIKYFEDGVNPEIWDYQFSFDSLAQVYNLMELYTQINYVDCYPARSIFSFGISENQQHSDVNLSKQISESSFHSQNSLNSLDTSITYTFENSQITSFNGRKYFEFDISLSDSINGIYFYDAIVKFKYDTLTFGSNIKAHQKLTATRNIVTLNPIAYGNPAIYDSQDDIAIITIPGRAQSTTSYYELLQVPTPCTHVQIEILDCGHINSLDQVTASIFASYTTNSNLAPPTFHYNTINVANSIAFPGCGTMFVNSILPHTVRAGTLDTVIIRGVGFGATRGNGNVFLKNADTGGSTYLHLDSVDYLPNGWSDNEIKFIMPSVVDTSNLYSKRGTPGSGFVKIRNNFGDSINNILDDIEVEFGVTNSFSTVYGKHFSNLTPPDADRAFTFRPDTSFVNHPDRMACLDATIKQWVCLTTVNFKLGTQLTDSSLIPVQDSICFVKFGDLDSGTVAQCSRFIYYRAGNCHTAYCREMDVFVNKALIFSADTTQSSNVPSGQFDLYQVLLHEFGHAHMLTHINDASKVMWWGATNAGISASNRRIKLMNDIPAISAGNYVVSNSIQVDTINCPFFKMTLGATNCTGVIEISEINKPNINLSLYPNPTTSELYLNYDLESSANVKTSIIDFFGREVYSNEERLSHGI